MAHDQAGRDDYTIRRAEADDADALAGLMQALHEHLKQPSGNISPQALAQDIFIDNSAHTALLAERGGDLIGYALFHESYESIYAQRGLYMADLYVSPEARGQGVGRALVASVAAHAKASGMKFVWWVSEAWDEKAQGFYAAIGAIHEPMVAHSVSRESFERLAGEAGGKRGG